VILVARVAGEEKARPGPTERRRTGAAQELRLATDDPSYLPWMVEHACTHPAFEWLAERPADWRAVRANAMGRPAAFCNGNRCTADAGKSIVFIKTQFVYTKFP
jgi:hypothetical protein